MIYSSTLPQPSEAASAAPANAYSTASTVSDAGNALHAAAEAQQALEWQRMRLKHLEELVQEAKAQLAQAERVYHATLQQATQARLLQPRRPIPLTFRSDRRGALAAPVAPARASSASSTSVMSTSVMSAGLTWEPVEWPQGVQEVQEVQGVAA